MNLQQTLNTAITIAKTAGNVLREQVGQQQHIEHKSSAIDWVTDTDKQAERLIVEQLRAAFPKHNLVTEEGTAGPGGDSQASDYTWYVDPLDGTTNFAHGFPVFAVSLALWQGPRPLVGVVYDPTRNECFQASAGQGTYLGVGEGPWRRLAVSPADMLIRSLLATGFPYNRHTSDVNLAEMAAFLKRAQAIRRAGAAALDFAYVAAGRLDGYWEYTLNTWDVAAGVLLVEEAGGRVTLIDGQPFALSSKVSYVASNGRIHDQMLQVLQEVARSK